MPLPGVPVKAASGTLVVLALFQCHLLFVAGEAGASVTVERAQLRVSRPRELTDAANCEDQACNACRPGWWGPTCASRCTPWPDAHCALQTDLSLPGQCDMACDKQTGAAAAFCPCGCRFGFRGHDCTQAFRPTSAGRSFVVATTRNLVSNGLTQLLIVSRQGGPVTVRYTSQWQVNSLPAAMDVEVHHTLLPNVVQAVTLPLYLMLLSSTSNPTARAVFVEADGHDIVVYASNIASLSSDAVTVLPIEVLGTSYVVASYLGRSNVAYSLAAVVHGLPRGAPARVTVLCPVDCWVTNRFVAARTPFTFILPPSSALQLTTFDSQHDLTGTLITSDLPVAVLGGHERAGVPLTSTCCYDALSQQFPPSPLLGRSYAAVPSGGRTGGDVFRIVASVEGTEVTVTTAGSIAGMLHVNTHQLVQAGSFLQIDVPSHTAAFINCSKPCLVTQYAKGGQVDRPATGADPYMAMLPAVDQFDWDYTVATSPRASGTSFANFMTVVTLLNAVEGVRVDGQMPVGVHEWRAVPGSQYAFARFRISEGAHWVTHTDLRQRMGVTVYGFAPDDSYGYYGGMRFTTLGTEGCVPGVPEPRPGDGIDNDCDGRVDEELMNGLDDDGDGVVDEPDLLIGPPQVTFAADLPAPEPCPFSDWASLLPLFSQLQPGQVLAPNAQAAAGITVTAEPACVERGATTVTVVDVSVHQPSMADCRLRASRSVRVEDACGNVVTAEQTVFLGVTGSRPPAPLISAPADALLPCGADPAPGPSLPAGAATAVAGCAGAAQAALNVTVTWNDAVMGAGCVRRRTWRAVDACGSESEAVQVVAVNDPEPPALHVPPDVQVNCLDSTLPARTGAATATSRLACFAAAPVHVQYEDALVAGASLQACPRTLQRTWTATDDCGNTATGVQRVAVVACGMSVCGRLDATPPAITVPGALTVPCGHSLSPVITGWPTTTDDCFPRSGVRLEYQDSVNVDFADCPIVVRRTWTATDGCGNAASAAQDIFYGTDSLPVAPRVGALRVARLPLLAWQPFVVGQQHTYSVWLWRAQSPAPAQPVVAGIPASRTRHDVTTPLQHGAQYLWRVQAVEGGAAVASTPVWGFTTQPMADMVAVAVRAPPSAFTGQRISVEYEVRNQGSGPVQLFGGWDDQLFLSASNLPRPPPAGQATEARRQLAAVAPGETYTGTVMLTLPRASSGTFFVCLFVAMPPTLDADMQNNALCSSGMTVALTPPPDLTVTAATAPALAFSGSVIDVTWTVRNAGPGTAIPGSWQDTVRVREAGDAAGNSAVVLASVWRAGVLQPGQQYSVAARVQLPPRRWGNFELLVRTNALEHVYEHGAMDNNDGAPMGIEVTLAPPPDLSVSDVRVSPTALLPLGDLTIEYDVTNVGPGAPFEQRWSDTVTLLAAPGAALPLRFANMRLDTRTASVLRLPGASFPPGASYTERLVFQLPAGVQAGEYVVQVRTDAFGQVFQHNFGQHTVRSSPVLRVERRLPDLRVLALQGPAHVLQGGALRWQALLCNNGTLHAGVVAAQARVTEVVVEPHLQPEAGAPAAAPVWLPTLRVPVAGLDVGACVPLEHQSAVGKWATAATYRLALRVNGGEQLPELTRAGLKAWPAQSVTQVATLAPQLSLAFVNGSVSASTGSVEVHWRVRNVGNAPVAAGSAWQDRVVLVLRSGLSPDALSASWVATQQRGDAVLLAMHSTVLHHALPPGGEAWFNTAASMPDGMLGEVRVGVQLDVGGLLRRSSAQAPVRFSLPFRAGAMRAPDLSLREFAVTVTDAGWDLSPAARHDMVLRAAWRVRNDGNTMATEASWHDELLLLPVSGGGEGVVVARVPARGQLRYLDEYGPSVTVRLRGGAAGAAGEAGAPQAQDGEVVRVPPGRYRVVVRANSGGELVEVGSSAGNQRERLQPIEVQASPSPPASEQAPIPPMGNWVPGVAAMGTARLEVALHVAGQWPVLRLRAPERQGQPRYHALPSQAAAAAAAAAGPVLRYTVTNVGQLPTAVGSWTDQAFLVPLHAAFGNSTARLQESGEIAVDGASRNATQLRVPLPRLLGADHEHFSSRFAGSRVHVGVLLPGEAYSAEIALQAPPGLLAGTYVPAVSVAADALSLVTLAAVAVDETAVALFPVHVAAPGVLDLQPRLAADMRVASASVRVGESVSIAYDVTLAGEGAAGNLTWRDKVLLSEDCEPSPLDIALGWQPVAAWLPHAGALARVSLTATVPEHAPQGAACLIVIVNADNGVPEFPPEARLHNVLRFPVSVGAVVGLTGVAAQDLRVRGEGGGNTSFPVGSSLAVSLRVCAAGAAEVDGTLVLSAFLATGGTWSADAAYLGRIVDAVALQPAGPQQTPCERRAASLSGMFRVPHLPHADYHLLLLDARALEAAARSGGGAEDPELVLADWGAVQVTVQQLPLNATLRFPLPNLEEQLFAVQVPPELEGATLLVTLGSEQWEALNEVYASYRAVPSPVTFDHGFTNALAANQSVVLPDANAGTYYVLVRNNGAGGRGGDAQVVELSVRAGVLRLHHALPQVVAPGVATLALAGDLLGESTEVLLCAASATPCTNSSALRRAALAQVDSTSAAYVTLNLTALPAGDYVLAAHDAFRGLVGQGEAELRVADSLPAGEAQFAVSIPRLALLTVERVAGTVTVLNTGYTDVVAPVLRLVSSSPHVLLRVMDGGAEDGAAASEPRSEVYVVARALHGPAGIIMPQARTEVRLELVVAAEVDTSRLSQLASTVQVEAVEDGPRMTLLNAVHLFQHEVGFTSQMGWRAVQHNAQRMLGGSGSSLLRGLSRVCSHLSAHGVRYALVPSLLAHVLAAADGAAGMPVLELRSDVVAHGQATPWAPRALALQRTYSPLLSRRGALGAFGLGWSWTGDLRVLQASRELAVVALAGKVMTLARVGGSAERWVGAGVSLALLDRADDCVAEGEGGDIDCPPTSHAKFIMLTPTADHKTMRLMQFNASTGWLTHIHLPAVNYTLHVHHAQLPVEAAEWAEVQPAMRAARDFTSAMLLRQRRHVVSALCEPDGACLRLRYNGYGTVSLAELEVGGARTQLAYAYELVGSPSAPVLASVALGGEVVAEYSYSMVAGMPTLVGSVERRLNTTTRFDYDQLTGWSAGWQAHLPSGAVQGVRVEADGLGGASVLPLTPPASPTPASLLRWTAEQPRLAEGVAGAPLQRTTESVQRGGGHHGVQLVRTERFGSAQTRLSLTPGYASVGGRQESQLVQVLPSGAQVVQQQVEASLGSMSGGTVTRFVDTSGREHAMQLDAQERVVQYRLPSGATWSAAYGELDGTDAQGARKWYETRAPDGSGLRREQDEAGRVLRIASLRDPSRPLLTTAYDSAGRLSSLRNELGSVQLEWAGEQRLMRLRGATGESVQYQRDEAGRVRGVRTSLGLAVEMEMDGEQVREVRLANGTVVVRVEADALGRPERLRHGDGLVTEVRYDVQGRLVESRLQNATGHSRGAWFKLQLDARGVPRSKESHRGQWSYTSDNLLQLTSFQAPDGRTVRVAYDPSGNRRRYQDSTGVTRHYVANADSQYTHVGRAGGMLHDARGNVVEVRESEEEGGGVLRLSYDELNAVREWEWADERAEHCRAGYDGAGTLVDLRCLSSDGGRSNVTWTTFLTDPSFAGAGHAVVWGSRTRQCNGTLASPSPCGAERTMHYVHLPDGQLAAAVDAETQEVFVYQFDWLGNVVGVVDAAGELVNEYEYDPFGQLLYQRERWPNPFKLAGAFSAISVGGRVVYMRARFYLPSHGRFLRPDPMSVASGSLNPYAYVNNQVLIAVDPSGEIIVHVRIAIAAAKFSFGAYKCWQQKTNRHGCMTALVVDTVTSAVPINNKVIKALVDLGGRVAVHVANRYGEDGVLTLDGLGDVVLDWALDNTIGFAVDAAFSSILAVLPDFVRAKVSEHVSFWELDEMVKDSLKNQGRNLVRDWQTERCGHWPPCDEAGWRQVFRAPVDFVMSFDPNDIVGPDGVGAARFVSAQQPLQYMVRFENEAEAGAWARRVEVLLPLPDGLDIRTLRVREFAFGNLTVTLPAPAATVAQRLRVAGPGGPEALVVDVFGGLDVAARRLRFVLQALEPRTLREPVDPLAGLLPPNSANGTEGQGHVAFEVMGRADAETGTRVELQADIVFDTNAPIVTPPVFNTLDTTPPTANLTLLANSSSASHLLLAWGVHDGPRGSGVRSVDVLQVLEDGTQHVVARAVRSSSMVVRAAHLAPGFAQGERVVGVVVLVVVPVDMVGNRAALAQLPLLTVDMARLWSCDGVAACSGHGTCTGADACECSEGYTGSDCASPTPPQGLEPPLLNAQRHVRVRSDAISPLPIAAQAASPGAQQWVTLQVSGLPAGSVLWPAVPLGEATGGSTAQVWRVNVSALGQEGLQVQPPAAFEGTAHLQLEATTVDAATLLHASRVASMSVLVVQPALPTVQLHARNDSTYAGRALPLRNLFNVTTLPASEPEEWSADAATSVVLSASGLVTLLVPEGNHTRSLTGMEFALSPEELDQAALLVPPETAQQLRGVLALALEASVSELGGARRVVTVPAWAAVTVGYCGDGVLHAPAEECDEAAALCCDATTCLVRAQGQLCRPAAGTCDTPEYCNGSHAHCPADGVLPAHVPCANQEAGQDEECVVFSTCTGQHGVCVVGRPLQHVGQPCFSGRGSCAADLQCQCVPGRFSRTERCVPTDTAPLAGELNVTDVRVVERAMSLRWRFQPNMSRLHTFDVAVWRALPGEAGLVHAELLRSVKLAASQNAEALQLAALPLRLGATYLVSVTATNLAQLSRSATAVVRLPTETTVAPPAGQTVEVELEPPCESEADCGTAPPARVAFLPNSTAPGESPHFRVRALRTMDFGGEGAGAMADPRTAQVESVRGRAAFTGTSFTVDALPASGGPALPEFRFASWLTMSFNVSQLLAARRGARWDLAAATNQDFLQRQLLLSLFDPVSSRWQPAHTTCAALALAPPPALDAATGQFSVSVCHLTQFALLQLDLPPEPHLPLPHQHASAGVHVSLPLTQGFTDDNTPAPQLRISAQVELLEGGELGGQAGFAPVVGALQGEARLSGRSTLVGGGLLNVSMTAEDEVGQQAQRWFLLTVRDDPPVVHQPIISVTARAGVRFAFTLPADTFRDHLTPAHQLQLAGSLAMVANVTARGQPGLAFRPGLQGEALIQGTCTVPGNSTQLANVTATDEAGNAVATQFLVQVTDEPPRVARPVPDQLAQPGEQFNMRVPARTFADALTPANRIRISGRVQLEAEGVRAEAVGLSVRAGLQGTAAAAVVGRPILPLGTRVRVTLVAHDEGGNTASTTFEVQVGQRPELMPAWLVVGIALSVMAAMVAAVKWRLVYRSLAAHSTTTPA